MPGTAAGTGWFGTQLLDAAKSIGFTPNNSSIMPLDGGFNGGSSQVSALENMHGLLMSHLGMDSVSACAWNSATAYTGGAVVSYGGHKWTAKWWTQGDVPGRNSQAVWTDNGNC